MEKVRGKREEGRPDVCAMDCGRCSRGICTGAAAIAREAEREGEKTLNAQGEKTLNAQRSTPNAHGETPLKAAAKAAVNLCDMIDGLSDGDACRAIEVLKKRITVSMFARKNRAADDQAAPEKRYCLFDRKTKKYATLAEITNDDGTEWSILWKDDVEEGGKFRIPDAIIVESYLMLFSERFGEKHPQRRFDAVEVAAYAATPIPTMPWKCLNCGNKWRDLRECGPVVQAGCPACGSKNILDCNVDAEVRHA